MLRLIPLPADTYMAISDYPKRYFLHNLLLAGSSASDFLVVGIGGLLLFLQRLLASGAVDSSRAS